MLTSLFSSKSSKPLCRVFSLFPCISLMRARAFKSKRKFRMNAIRTKFARIQKLTNNYTQMHTMHVPHMQQVTVRADEVFDISM